MKGFFFEFVYDSFAQLNIKDRYRAANGAFVFDAANACRSTDVFVDKFRDKRENQHRSDTR